MKVELAAWNGNAAEAFEQLDVALKLLGDGATQPHLRAAAHALHGHFADDLGEAREHLAAACQAAAERGHAPLVVRMIVAVAGLAVRRERYEQAARLLAASASVLGLTDQSNPYVSRIEQAARHHLGDAAFDAAVQDDAKTWHELVAVTLAP